MQTRQRSLDTVSNSLEENTHDLLGTPPSPILNSHDLVKMKESNRFYIRAADLTYIVLQHCTYLLSSALVIEVQSAAQW